MTHSTTPPPANSALNLLGPKTLQTAFGILQTSNPPISIATDGRMLLSFLSSETMSVRSFQTYGCHFDSPLNHLLLSNSQQHQRQYEAGPFLTGFQWAPDTVSNLTHHKNRSRLHSIGKLVIHGSSSTTSLSQNGSFYFPQFCHFSSIRLLNFHTRHNTIHSFKKGVRQMTRSEIHFGVIPKEHWSYPEWIDQEKAAKERQRMAADHVIYASSESYRHMCVFFGVLC